MLFYKITAEIEKTVTDTAKSSRDIRAAERERNEDICAETDDFWDNNLDWFLFVNAITSRKVIAGAVSMTPIAQQKGMTLAPGVEEKLLPIFRQTAKDSEFGNGRFARNLVERAKVRQATRLVSMQDTGLCRDTVTTLQPEDFEAPAGIMDRQKRTIGFAGWG